MWVEAGHPPELRLTVPGLLVVCTRRTGPGAPTEMACLTEADGALWLSLRRYAVLHTVRRNPWYAAPDVIDGRIVTGIDLTAEQRGGLVVGGPMVVDATVPPHRMDPGRVLEALPWFWRLGWTDGHARLCAVIGA